MFLAVAAPTGGLGNLPALIKGDPGDPPTIDTTIDFLALEPDDAAPDSAEWVETSPGVYQLSLELHKGPKGDEGVTTLIDASDLTGTPVAGNIIVVNATLDGFEFASPKIGDMYWPADIDSAPHGSVTFTLAAVSVPAQGFAWRPHVEGQTTVTASGNNVRCDLVARLGDSNSGNIVGRGSGLAGTSPPPISLSSGPPAGSADGYNRIEAGTPAVIYLCIERVGGISTFYTSASTTYFSVEVKPIP